MTSPVDIRPDHLEIVRGILREHLPAGVKVWVFGSRASWTTKDSSDLDLALEGENALSHKLLGVLKDAFEDSVLPYTVDVVDIKTIGDSFRQIVKSQRAPLPMRVDVLDCHATSESFRKVIERDSMVVQEGVEPYVVDNSTEWLMRPLGDLTDNFDAVRIPMKQSDRRPGPYPYYGASGVVDHVDSYLFDGEYLLIAEDGENLRTRNTPIAFLAKGKFWVNNHAHIVRGNTHADTRFLKYAELISEVVEIVRR